MPDILNKSIAPDHCKGTERLMPVLIVSGPPNISLRDGRHLREDLPQAGLPLPGENRRPEILDRLVKLHSEGGGGLAGVAEEACKYSHCYC